jgi:pimeloyl-ACP methyl ester carboxylesterase
LAIQTISPERRVADPEQLGIVPPPTSYHFIDLPKTRLHYMQCGEGEPLVMVPATISRLENWRALVQFMGQHFRVYFFELPGHGKSSPFPEPFRTRLVAETVEAFLNKLRLKTVSLMGFSFGGILTLETLRLLQDRVQNVILLAPALTKRALQFEKIHLWLVRNAVKVLKQPGVRAGLLRLIRNKRFSPLMASVLARFSNLEKNISMDEVFRNISDSTADVLSYQLDELLNFEPTVEPQPFSQPCYFAMSVNDPVLDFDTTADVVGSQFSHVHVERFTHTYHQPPHVLSFNEIFQKYNPLLDYIVSN